MNDILKLISGLDKNRLVLTLDMILSLAALVERLILTFDDDKTQEDLLKDIAEIDAKYAEQKAIMKARLKTESPL